MNEEQAVLIIEQLRELNIRMEHLTDILKIVLKV